MALHYVNDRQPAQNNTTMKPKKKTNRGESNNGNDPQRKSTLVIETNPKGAKREEKGPNAEGAKGKLVDGESTNDGR